MTIEEGLQAIWEALEVIDDVLRTLGDSCGLQGCSIFHGWQVCLALGKIFSKPLDDGPEDN